MDDALIGTIQPWPMTWAPKNWVLCNGHLYDATGVMQPLFSLIGNRYGGNGSTNYKVPDLRGQIPLCSGAGVGTTNYPLGQQGGAFEITLQAANLPAHTHAATVTPGSAQQVPFADLGIGCSMRATSAYGNTNDPRSYGTYLGNAQVGAYQGYNFTDSPPAGSLSNVAGLSVGVDTGAIKLPAPDVTVTNASTGDGDRILSMPPYLTINFIICFAGEFPTRP